MSKENLADSHWVKANMLVANLNEANLTGACVMYSDLPVTTTNSHVRNYNNYILKSEKVLLRVREGFVKVLLRK